MLALPAGAYIDDFSSLYRLLDVPLPAQLWDFGHDVPRVALHEDKFQAGIQPLFLGMQMTVSRAGISLRPRVKPVTPCSVAAAAPTWRGGSILDVERDPSE